MVLCSYWVYPHSDSTALSVGEKNLSSPLNLQCKFDTHTFFLSGLSVFRCIYFIDDADSSEMVFWSPNIGANNADTQDKHWR